MSRIFVARPRVVIDTDVFFEGFDRIVRPGRPDHPYLDVLDAGISGEYIALWSEPTLNELKIMLYDSTKALQRNFRAHGPQDVVDILVRYGESVAITGKTYAEGPDRNDDMFVETAIVGGAEFLVAEDYRHFHVPAVKALLERHGCDVLSAADFIAIIGRTPEPT
jgi:predicted nucleic acid-binding protein